MKKSTLLYGIAILAAIGITIGFSPPNIASPNSSKGISNTQTKVLETPFDKMMAVLMHKRCINCHPSDDYPRQGEDSHIHNFGVMRGPENHGVAALRCES